MNLPDVETMVHDFLKPLVAPTKVVTKVPANRPASFVRIFRTGGAASNRVLDRALITVQAWHSTGAKDAFDLATVCRNAFFNNYTSMPLVRGVEEVGGLRFDPDPDTNVDRYTFSVQLMVRASR